MARKGSRMKDKLCIWQYACPYCLAGFIPIRSSVSDAMVHPDSPVGRILCEGRDKPTVLFPPRMEILVMDGQEQVWPKKISHSTKIHELETALQRIYALCDEFEGDMVLDGKARLISAIRANESLNRRKMCGLPLGMPIENDEESDIPNGPIERCQLRHPEGGQCELRAEHSSKHLAGMIMWASNSSTQQEEIKQDDRIREARMAKFREGQS